MTEHLGANAMDPPNGLWSGERHPKGGAMKEWPTDLRVRQWPGESR